MRKSLWSLLAIALMAGSCLKKDTGCPYSESNTVAPSQETAEIESYLSSNNITTATKHPCGMYYEIISAGTGDSPHLCSQVRVAYTGKLTSGAVFDHSAGTVFTLGSLIEGWKKGLLMLKKGGSIKLYIPPSLGYGYSDVTDPQTQAVIIPAGSMLIFDVTLSDLG